MLNNPFFKMLANVIGKTQKSNKENPDVETADESVFNNVRDRAEKSAAESSGTKSRQDLYKEMARHVDDARKENEANPNIVTAHSSVFEDMMKKLEDLKAEQSSTTSNKVDSEMILTANAKSGTVLATYDAASKAKFVNKMARTNSFGGSLALRLNPDFGSPVNSVRIPDQASVKILQLSDKTIMLDGIKSNWVMVDYHGQQGWVLDSYIGQPIQH